MRRISQNLFFVKRVFPVLWFGFFAFLMFTMLTNLGAKGFSPMAVIFPIFMAGVGFVMMKRLVWGLADEVWDDGDALVVRDKGMESRIPLTNIINVSSSAMSNPPRITLTLREPCAFGNEVSFSPPRRFGWLVTIHPGWFATMHPLAKELIQRIDEQRRSR